MRFWEIGKDGEGKCVRELTLGERDGFVSCIVEFSGTGVGKGCLLGTERGALFRVHEEGEPERMIEAKDAEGVEDMMWMGEELYVLGEKGGITRYTFVDGRCAREVEQVADGLRGTGCGRLAWLREQGKKVMVEDWKGKKRRYDQVVEDEA